MVFGAYVSLLYCDTFQTPRQPIKKIGLVINSLKKVGVALKLMKGTLSVNPINYPGYVMRLGRLEFGSHVTDAMHDQNVQTTKPNHDRLLVHTIMFTKFWLVFQYQIPLDCGKHIRKSLDSAV